MLLWGITVIKKAAKSRALFVLDHADSGKLGFLLSPLSITGYLFSREVTPTTTLGPFPSLPIRCHGIGL